VTNPPLIKKKERNPLLMMINHLDKVMINLKKKLLKEKKLKKLKKMLSKMLLKKKNKLKKML
jgi:hypothetical protein